MTLTGSFAFQGIFFISVRPIVYRFALNRESERILRSLTSTSSIRPELMAEGSRVAAGIFNGRLPDPRFYFSFF